ncbi:topology modulation protein [Halobacillus litoralis]|uniref:Topology modulation protein n=1 Tax=Halobacillus litoralis TaxID=45668 RepID=A0A410MD24_9BACI|nr:topology modulation protein [Halobacillus litoralis]QAS52610.1 topology modulation protein [Halobacillus litoralis]
MQRIMVLGVSSGVGKSTFAKELGRLLDIEVYHLDRFYWEPGWKEAALEDFRARQQEVIQEKAWIIEGNYSNTYDIRADKADTIIYLELPLHVCLFRVFKRRFTYRGKTRADMGEGCEEKLDADFLKFIWKTYHPRKGKMQQRFQEFQNIGQQKDVIQLKSKKEIDTFLARF